MLADCCVAKLDNSPIKDGYVARCKLPTSAPSSTNEVSPSNDERSIQSSNECLTMNAGDDVPEVIQKVESD